MLLACGPLQLAAYQHEVKGHCGGKTPLQACLGMLNNVLLH